MIRRVGVLVVTAGMLLTVLMLVLPIRISPANGSLSCPSLWRENTVDVDAEMSAFAGDCHDASSQRRVELAVFVAVGLAGGVVVVWSSLRSGPRNRERQLGS